MILKDRLLLCQIIHHVKELYEGVEVLQLHVFLTSALGADEYSASHLKVSPRGIVPWHPSDGKADGPQNRSGCDGEGKIPWFGQEWNLGRLQPVVIITESDERVYPSMK
jgi:hypothetical protein